MATTNAAVNDMVLVGGEITSGSQHAPGLYFVVGVSGSGLTASYSVRPVDQENSTMSMPQQVPQKRVIAVYKQD